MQIDPTRPRAVYDDVNFIDDAQDADNFFDDGFEMFDHSQSEGEDDSYELPLPTPPRAASTVEHLPRLPPRPLLPPATRETPPVVALPSASDRDSGNFDHLRPLSPVASSSSDRPPRKRSIMQPTPEEMQRLKELRS